MLNGECADKMLPITERNLEGDMVGTLISKMVGPFQGSVTLIMGQRERDVEKKV